MRVIQVLDDHRLPSEVTALHFSADGRSLVAMVRMETWVLYPRRWDLHQNAVVEDGVGIGCQEDTGFAPELAFSPDERFLSYVFIERGPELSLRLVDRSAKAKSRTRERRLTPWAGCRSCLGYLSLQFTPDGRTLVAAVMNQAEEGDHAIGEVGATGIYCWSLARVLKGRGKTWDKHLLADKRFLPLADPDVQAWHGVGKSLAISPDGSALAVGLWKDRVRYVEFPSGIDRPAPAVGTRRNLGAWPLAHSPDGRTLAVADETVTLYDASTGASRVVLPPGPPVQAFVHGRKPRPIVRDLAFSPNGRLLATIHGDPVVRWWDAASGAA